MKRDAKLHVAIYSFLWAIVLTAAKTVVGLLTGSLGVLSEALHSATDLLAAGVTVLAVRQSSKPADQDHQFGHGKYENLSALFETLLLIGSCVWIFWEAIDRIVNEHPAPEINFWAFAVIILAIFIDWHRARALGKAAREHRSQALEADALHFSSDILSSFAVLLGLVASRLGYAWADPLAAIIVGCVIFAVAWRLTRRSVDALLDRAPKGVAESICEQVGAMPGIGHHVEARVRSQGPSLHVDIVIRIDGQQSLQSAHDLATAVERVVEDAYRGADVNVHVEPLSDVS